MYAKRLVLGVLAPALGGAVWWAVTHLQMKPDGQTKAPGVTMSPTNQVTAPVAPPAHTDNRIEDARNNRGIIIQGSPFTIHSNRVDEVKRTVEDVLHGAVGNKPMTVKDTNLKFVVIAVPEDKVNNPSCREFTSTSTIRQGECIVIICPPGSWSVDWNSSLDKGEYHVKYDGIEVPDMVAPGLSWDQSDNPTVKAGAAFTLNKGVQSGRFTVTFRRK